MSTSKKTVIKDRKNTITYRIFICFLITVIALLMLLAYYMVNVYRVEISDLQDNFTRDANYVNAELDRVVDSLVDSAQTVGYTTAVQKCLFSDNPSDKIQNITTARELVATYRDNNDYITDFFYYSDDGHLYTISSYYREFREVIEDMGEDKILTLKKGFLSDYTIEEKDAYFFFYLLPIYRTAQSISHQNDRIGVCGILCDFSSLLSDAGGLISDDYACYILYKGRIISSCYELEGITASDVANLGNDFGNKTLNGRKYYTYSMRSNDWQISMISYAEKINFFKKGESKQLYFLLVICCVMFIAMLLFISRRFSNEVSQMVLDLNSLKGGTQNARVSIPKGRELETIALEINNMIERLEAASESEKKAQDQVYSAAMAQQAAEMTAYRSQINPHFFFNTLETIRSMSKYYHADMIEDIISAMSKMFRYSLYAETVVTMAREVDILEQYFLITSYRFPDQYELVVHMQEGTEEFPVPSMILQPLVENSIKHAFGKNRPGKKNRIEVASTLLDDGRLRIAIMDNGKGMTPEELSQLEKLKTLEDKVIRTRDSIGIHNIYERIKLFNKDNNMEFFSEYGRYTKVELSLHPTDMSINTFTSEK